MRKKRWVLLLLLLPIFGIGWWKFLPAAALPVPTFVKQGENTITGKGTEIHIGDYSVIDGDTVDFYFDGKLIFQQLGLSDTPKIYRPGNLLPGTHILGIRSIQDGDLSPASPYITVVEGAEKQSFFIDAYRDSLSGSWELIVK